MGNETVGCGLVGQNKEVPILLYIKLQFTDNSFG